MLGKLIAAAGSGCHGDRARAQSFATRNIARRIANHIDFRSGKLATVFFVCAGAGEWSEPVAVSMVIGESAKFKKVPDPVMFEL
jgi:hypothetical protein